MSEQNDDAVLIDRYLCDELAGAARESFERRYLESEELFEALGAAEDELLCRLVRGDVGEPRRSRLLARYSSTPELRERLDLAQGLHAVAIARLPKARSAAPSRPWRAWLRRWLEIRRLTPALAVAVLIVAIVVGTMWRRGEKPAGSDALIVASLMLDPGLTRGPGTPRLDVPASRTGNVRIDLRVGDLAPSTSVRAALRAVGQTQPVWTGEAVRGTGVVTILVPRRLLTRGDYLVRLGAVGAGGRAAAMDTYVFGVER